MKLDESLQQLFRQYGHGILLEESIVTKLTGLKSFDSSPALREAVKFLSDGGYLRELLARSRRNDPADFALYTEYLRKFLAAGGKFDEAVVSGAVGSLSSALGHEAAPVREELHGLPEGRGGVEGLKPRELRHDALLEKDAVSVLPEELLQ